MELLAAVIMGAGSILMAFVSLFIFFRSKKVEQRQAEATRLTNELAIQIKGWKSMVDALREMLADERDYNKRRQSNEEA